MKKFISISLVLLSIILLCSCDSQNTENQNGENNNESKVEATTIEQIFKDSKYLGKWYNADTPEDFLIYEFLADGTAIYEGTYKGTWVDNGNDITITIKKDGTDVVMTGYFVIAGDGFVARATDANMHYLDEGGTLQLEIMLTDTTCVDCVQK